MSKTGVWDGSGNVWEWMGNAYESSDTEIGLRGGAWNSGRRDARVSVRPRGRPDSFNRSIGVRVVVGPVLK